MSEASKRGAVLQFEIDRKRWGGMDRISRAGGYEDTPSKRLDTIAQLAVRDTIQHGGTFVLVATADKVTIIQRPDAEDEI